MTAGAATYEGLGPRQIVTRIAVLGWLLVSTTLFFSYFPRFQGTGPELLHDPGFRDGLAHWQVSGRGRVETHADGGVRLSSPEARDGVALRQSVADPQRFRRLRLRAELAAEDIVGGQRSWHRGRLALVAFDDRQRMIPVPHVVADLDGSRGWQRYEAVLAVPATVAELRVSAQLIGATGTLALRNPSLREVRERTAWQVLRVGGAIVWLAGLGWVLAPLRRRLRWDAAHVAGYLLVAAIFIGTLAPVPVKVEVQERIGGWVASLLVEGDLTDPASAAALAQLRADPNLISKAGHFLLFMLLALSVSWAYRGRRRQVLVLALLALAAISEVLQFFVDGRLPRLGDLLIDAAGVALGLLLAWPWWRRRERGPRPPPR